MNVRMANPVVEALHALPHDQAAAVARAVQRIGTSAGVPLKTSDEDDTEYMIMATDAEAPVVIYRALPEADGGGYLVTGLGDRGAYHTYISTEQSGFLASPLGKGLLGLAAAVALGIAIGSRSTKGIPIP
jgi:hypothetical protein